VAKTTITAAREERGRASSSVSDVNNKDRRRLLEEREGCRLFTGAERLVSSEGDPNKRKGKAKNEKRISRGAKTVAIGTDGKLRKRRRGLSLPKGQGDLTSKGLAVRAKKRPKANSQGGNRAHSC